MILIPLYISITLLQDVVIFIVYHERILYHQQIAWGVQKATNSTVKQNKGLRKKLHLIITDTYKLLITLFNWNFILIWARLGNGQQSGDKPGAVHFLIILLLPPTASDFCTIKACVFSKNCLTEGL